jgi:hypothetical protein
VWNVDLWYVAPPLENPLSDLSEIENQSAPLDKIYLPNFNSVCRDFRHDKLFYKIRIKKKIEIQRKQCTIDIKKINENTKAATSPYCAEQVAEAITMKFVSYQVLR